MVLDEYIYRVTFEYTDRLKRKCRGLTVVTDSSWEQAVEQTREKFLVDTFDQIGGRVISESEAEQQPVYWELVKK